MKKILFTLLLLNVAFTAFPQSPIGLIAHWNLDSTTNDVSGNGHHGHARNLTMAVGEDGIMGHAWYFNGSNSVITIPASPAFNLNHFTIAATVNMRGFNAMPCHANMIFIRGRTSGTTGGGWYNLQATDYPAGYGCTPAIDSTRETFLASAYYATGGLGPASWSAYYYTPPIVKNTWYRVVATFNDTVYKLYVNSVLMVTVPITTPGVPIATGNDSAYIGLNLMEAGAGYPYPFKGEIDDVMLYNRVLTDSQIVHLHDPCTVAPITGIVNVCVGAAINLSNATANGTWSSGSSAIATIASGTGSGSGVSAGTAVISYITTLGCLATTTVTVSNNTTAVISGNTTLCTGATTTLSSSVNGGTWTSGNTNVATISNTGVVTGVASGTSIISYYSGCATGTATVTVITSLSAITGPTTLCQNTTTTLSNTAPGGTWSSNNTPVATINNAGVVTGISQGTAVISYTTSCGATTTTITVNAAPTISGNTTICTANTTTLTSSVGGGTWSSSAPGVATVSNTGVVTGMSPGTSVITYTITGGCFGTRTVTVNAAPSAISGGPTVCAGYTITLSNAAGGGTWTSGNVSVATVIGITANTGRAGGMAPGVAVITYTTGTGCMATISITVLAATPGADTIRGLSGVCTGNTIPLSNATSGGVWSSNTPGVATISNTGIVTGVSPGTAVISYTISGTCGVSFKTKTITVDVAPNAGTITGAASVCAGSSIPLSNSAPGGVWTSASTAVATVSATGVVSGVSEGTVVISYTVTNACGAASVTKTITVYGMPDAGTITGQDSVCLGAVFTLLPSVTGGRWSTATAAIATVDTISGRVHALSAGQAVITYTIGPNAGGCSGMATFTITVLAAPTFTISAAVTNIMCYGDANGSIAVTITGGKPPFHYLWSNGGTSATLIGLNAGGYILNVNEPATQCIKADSFYVSSPDSMGITATVKNDECNAGAGSVRVEVMGGASPYSYLWSNNMQDTAITGLTAGIYTVTVTDANTCAATFAATVKDDSCSNIKIHDVLTPNGDGINETWVIEGIGAYPGNSVSVFDKWGDAVYTKTNYNNDWTGTGKSGVLPDGTYFYVVKLPATGVKSEQVMTGAVMVKR